MFFTVVIFLLYAVVLLALSVLLGLLVYMYITTERKPPNYKFDSEKTYKDPNSGELKAFPHITDPSSVQLSVVVPSYNEEDRLPAMLNEAIEYLEETTKNRYEIIVVDDGSKDSTSEVALLYSEKYGTERVRVLTLEKNRGKGGAVRLGVSSCRGNLVLFADADGATTFADLKKLEDELMKAKQQGHEDIVVCGSRAHMEKDAIAERSLFRTFLMKGFHLIVWLLCVRGVRDTQCGFKLMTRSAARQLFHTLHVQRWAFDVELLYIAQTLNMFIGEVAVHWIEIEGSKMVPVWSWLQMGRDLLFIRMRYLLRLWKIEKIE